MDVRERIVVTIVVLVKEIVLEMQTALVICHVAVQIAKEIPSLTSLKLLLLLMIVVPITIHFNLVYSKDIIIILQPSPSNFNTF